MSWWLYPVFLFFIAFVIGIFSVIAGLGGGSIFVPFAATFFPFNFAFIRGAGLFVTLGSSLSSSHLLIKKGNANLKLALPFALSGSLFSVIGAHIGLAANDSILKLFLGLIMIILGITMVIKKKSGQHKIQKDDYFASLLKIGGEISDPQTGETLNWKPSRIVLSFVCFAVIGLISGIFGMGAGWAGVPVLNSISGVPIMIAAGTSNIIISVNAASAIWFYIEKNTLLPLIALPSFFGVFLGTKIGVRLIDKVKPASIRYGIIAFLIFSGINLLLRNIYFLLRG